MEYERLIELHAILYTTIEKNIANFIYAAFTLAFGLYSMCKLSDLQIEAIKLSGSIYTPPDFKKTYLASITAFNIMMFTNDKTGSGLSKSAPPNTSSLKLRDKQKRNH